MIINEVDIACIAVLKAERNPPVGALRDRPEALKIASQRMQAKARQAYVLHRGGGIEQTEDVLNRDID